MAIAGAKILAAVASGVAIYVGVKEFGKKTESSENEGPKNMVGGEQQRPVNNQAVNQVGNTGYQVQPPRDFRGVGYNNNLPTESKLGTTIMNALKVGQLFCTGTMEIIQSLSSVANNISRLLDRSSYSMIGDPSAGNYYGGSTNWSGQQGPRRDMFGNPYVTKTFQRPDGTVGHYLSAPGIIEFLD